MLRRKIINEGEARNRITGSLEDCGIRDSWRKWYAQTPLGMWSTSICHDLKCGAQSYKIGIWKKLTIVVGGLIREELRVLDLK